jgi:hypothetical protein
VREATLIFIIVPTLCIGCATPPPEQTVASEPVLVTLDGLVKREIEAPGVLYLHEAHQIGSYDAFQIATSSIAYERHSRQLPAEIEEQFTAKLEKSLVDAAAEADIPIVDPGPCVLRIGIQLEDVDIAQSTAKTLAEMKLVMEFRDSDSGQPLLRYITDNRVENQGDDVLWSDQIRDSFDEMVAGMEIGGPLRGAGLADDYIRPGCKGTLAERGRAAAETRSTP